MNDGDLHYSVSIPSAIQVQRTLFTLPQALMISQASSQGIVGYLPSCAMFSYRNLIEISFEHCIPEASPTTISWARILLLTFHQLVATPQS